MTVIIYRKTGLRILLPLALALSTIGKSQELLSALTIKPFQDDSVKCLASAKAHNETGMIFKSNINFQSKLCH